jgi:hypothetical protein
VARDLTASGLDLAELCPGPFVLDGVETSDAASAAGTGVHRQIAGWVNDPRGAQEDLIPPGPAGHACSWLLTRDVPVPYQGYRAEVAYALDPATGEVWSLGGGGARDYSVAPAGWICGTADLIATGPDEVLDIDWKAGAGAAFNHGPPGESLQLLFGAYCAAALVEGDFRNTAPPPTQWTVRGRVAYAYVSDDGVDLREAVIEPAAWPAVLERLRGVARRVEEARAAHARGALQVRAGEHCGRCPALLACPATRYAVALLSIPPMLQLNTATGTMEVTPADPKAVLADAPPALVSEALTRWRHVKRIGDAVEERAKLLARQGLLPGWRLQERERRELHGGVAFHVLKERLGEDVAREAVELHTSQSAIREVLRCMAQRAKEVGTPHPKGWLGQELEAVIADVEGRGGVETKSYEVLVQEEEGAAG